MELSTDMWIDVALNAVGYLAAGGLVIVLHSFFRRNPAGSVPATHGRPLAVQKESGAQAISSSTVDNMEYVEFGGAAGNRTDLAGVSESTDRRRNRGEVIRLARQMMAVGTSEEKIRDLLPITEAELSLLSLEK